VAARLSDLTFFGRINLNPNIALRLFANLIEGNGPDNCTRPAIPRGEVPSDHTPSAASFFEQT
jgi:hypothetical protein